ARKGSDSRSRPDPSVVFENSIASFEESKSSWTLSQTAGAGSRTTGQPAPYRIHPDRASARRVNSSRMERASPDDDPAEDAEREHEQCRAREHTRRAKHE